MSEAPRGLLYHRYRVDAEGTILDAKIVPPTSQNQRAIEDDLRDVVGRNAELDDEPLRALCEQTIRNYDPCISCATHFLDAGGGAAMRHVVIGVGNAFRGDDAVGLAVAERLRGRVPGRRRGGAVRARAEPADRGVGGRRRARSSSTRSTRAAARHA